MPPPITNYKAWFETKYLPEPNTGCWLWIAGCYSNGYGEVWYRRTMMPAHRAAWLIFRGEIPIYKGKTLYVLHKCNNILCVNYARDLYLGTQKQNLKQAHREGRMLPAHLYSNGQRPVNNQ